MNSLIHLSNVPLIMKMTLLKVH